MNFVKILFFSQLIFIGIGQAEVIKYTDAKGYTFFVDSIDKVPEEYKEQVKSLDNKHTISRIKSDRKNLYEKSHYENKSYSKNKKVEIFIADWCGYCKALEAALIKEKIPYQKYNIETSDYGRKTYRELGAGGIPITRINGKKILRGYSSLEPIKRELAKN